MRLGLHSTLQSTRQSGLLLRPSVRPRGRLLRRQAQSVSVEGWELRCSHSMNSQSWFAVCAWKGAGTHLAQVPCPVLSSSTALRPAIPPIIHLQAPQLPMPRTALPLYWRVLRRRAPLRWRVGARLPRALPRRWQKPLPTWVSCRAAVERYV